MVEIEEQDGIVTELQNILDQQRAAAGITEEQLSPRKLEAVREIPPATVAVEPDKNELDALRFAEIRERLAEVFTGRNRYAACHVRNYKCESPEQEKAAKAVTAFAKDIGANITEGGGIVFFGPPGTGKDHLMSFLIQSAVRADKSVTWKNGMDLFGEVRDRMDDDRSSERAFVNSMVLPDVLAISDPLPPFGELSPFQAAMLFRIIDGRYSRRKSTWVTLNVRDSDEGRTRLGSQSIDRLTDGALVIPCNWPSFRKPRS